MKQSPAGFYGFWASTPPLVAIGISLLITAMLWFGAIKQQLLPDHWTIPAHSDLLSDVGSFVDGHNNWKQPYNFLSKKNILIPLFCDPILPRVNRCLEEDGFYPSSYVNAPLKILYFQSSGEVGYGRHTPRLRVMVGPKWRRPLPFEQGFGSFHAANERTIRPPSHRRFTRRIAHLGAKAVTGASD